MGYVSGCQHDVFISYSHKDDISISKGEKGWVEQFHERLRVQLLQHTGEVVDLWRDMNKLRRAERFDSAIRGALDQSAIMLALVSNSFCKSDYCRKEIDWFLSERGHELAGDKYVRVFPILLYNLSPDAWPAPCKGTGAHKFFDESMEGVSQPLRFDSKEIRGRFYKLCEEIVEALGEIKVAESKRSVGADSQTIEDEKPFTIFLAHPADNLGPTRRQLAARLKLEKGIKLLDEIPPPHDESAHAETVRKAVESVDLSVHLLGDQPGEPIDESDRERTYPLEQARLGVEHAKSLLVLMPEEVNPELIENSSHSTFIHDLSTMDRDAEHLELIRTGRHQMVDEILAKRIRIEESIKAEKEKMEVSNGFITFIDLHASDVGQAMDLIGYLTRKEITPIMMPGLEMSPKTNMSLFLEQLKKSRLFLSFYGSVALNWVQQRLIAAHKLIVSHCLSTKMGVYVAPPSKSPDYVNFPCKVAVNTEGFDPATLDPLLENAGGNR